MAYEGYLEGRKDQLIFLIKWPMKDIYEGRKDQLIFLIKWRTFFQCFQ